MILLGTDIKAHLINLAIEIILEGQEILNRAINEEFIDFDFHANKLNHIVKLIDYRKEVKAHGKKKI